MAGKPPGPMALSTSSNPIVSNDMFNRRVGSDFGKHDPRNSQSLLTMSQVASLIFQPLSKLQPLETVYTKGESKSRIHEFTPCEAIGALGGKLFAQYQSSKMVRNRVLSRGRFERVGEKGKGKRLGRWKKRVTTDARRYYYRKEMHRMREVDEMGEGGGGEVQRDEPRQG
jgi:hypothetical protein